MNKIIVILASYICIIFPVSSLASPATSFQKGEYELTLVGSGSSDESFYGTTLSVEGGFGVFLQNDIEIALRQGLSYADRSGGHDWNASTRGALGIHFGLDPILHPFIGVNIGYLYGDSVEEQFIAGPEVGLKFFANESAFLFGLIEYEFLFEDPADVDDNFDDGRFVYSLGIGFVY